MRHFRTLLCRRLRAARTDCDPARWGVRVRAGRIDHCAPPPRRCAPPASTAGQCPRCRGNIAHARTTRLERAAARRGERAERREPAHLPRVARSELRGPIGRNPRAGAVRGGQSCRRAKPCPVCRGDFSRAWLACRAHRRASYRRLHSSRAW